MRKGFLEVFHLLLVTFFLDLEILVILDILDMLKIMKILEDFGDYKLLNPQIP